MIPLHIKAINDNNKILTLLDCQAPIKQSMSVNGILLFYT